jgi:hypothetical protein
MSPTLCPHFPTHRTAPTTLIAVIAATPELSPRWTCPSQPLALQTNTLFDVLRASPRKDHQALSGISDSESHFFRATTLCRHIKKYASATTLVLELPAVAVPTTAKSAQMSPHSRSTRCLQFCRGLSQALATNVTSATANPTSNLFPILLSTLPF